MSMVGSYYHSINVRQFEVEMQESYDSAVMKN